LHRRSNKGSKNSELNTRTPKGIGSQRGIVRDYGLSRRKL